MIFEYNNQIFKCSSLKTFQWVGVSLNMFCLHPKEVNDVGPWATKEVIFHCEPVEQEGRRGNINRNNSKHLSIPLAVQYIFTWSIWKCECPTAAVEYLFSLFFISSDRSFLFSYKTTVPNKLFNVNSTFQCNALNLY